MKIVPYIRVYFHKKHFIDFGLINDEIFEVTKKIKKQFGLTQKLNKIPNTFYFSPHLFYKGEDYLKIGA